MARTGAKPLTQVDGLMTKAKHLTPDLLRATCAAGDVGRPSSDKGDNITFSIDGRGDGASYKLARLKRDDPDLARPRAVWYPVP